MGRRTLAGGPGRRQLPGRRILRTAAAQLLPGVGWRAPRLVGRGKLRRADNLARPRPGRPPPLAPIGPDYRSVRGIVSRKRRTSIYVVDREYRRHAARDAVALKRYGHPAVAPEG